MRRLARFSLAATLLATAACQTFLVFTREGSDGEAGVVPDASLVDAAPEAAADGGLDAARAEVGPLDCDGAALCLDFEQDAAVESYGFTITVPGDGTIDECSATGAPVDHCLRWTQPSFMAGRPIEVDGNKFRWDVDVDCRFYGAQGPAFAYLMYVAFGPTWVVVACRNADAGLDVVQLVSHYSTNDGGGVFDEIDVGASPMTVSVEIDLPLRTAKLLTTDAGRPLSLPPETPSVVAFPQMGVGANTGPTFIVSLDDIRLWKLQLF